MSPVVLDRSGQLRPLRATTTASLSTDMVGVDRKDDHNLLPVILDHIAVEVGHLVNMVQGLLWHFGTKNALHMHEHRALNSTMMKPGSWRHSQALGARLGEYSA